jgi:hypothetical protein
MNKDLIDLYQKTNLLPQTPEVKAIQAELETLLVRDMQEHLFKVAHIGNVIGYEKTKAHLTNALNMLTLYEQQDEEKETK